METLFDVVVSSLWAPETYLKFLFLAVTAPFWWPLARAMYDEVLPALNAPEDTLPRRVAPGEDPFLNIPLASYRARASRQGAVRPRTVASARSGFSRRTL